ncbi:MAG: F-actin-capping protein subunit alpha [Piccolia ochrophora]|nr:MAG: F-actin-capping protein subunit alpha [Piccolia ochrophora]
MTSSKVLTLSQFIQDAPPGELPDVVADIKALSANDQSVIKSLEPAFKGYNEAQLTTTKLPGGSNEVIVSSYNTLDDGRYYDIESQSSFHFDHLTQASSAVQSYTFESKQSDVVYGSCMIAIDLTFLMRFDSNSLLKSLSTHVKEHYPSASYGVYPTEEDRMIAILIVANKYSPNNFWNGRWRSLYLFSPNSFSLDGTLKVDVHYYEDGNVRLLTDKQVSASASSSSAADIIKHVAAVEKKYQEELNRAFSNLSEGAFKGLRRQLPITRQKIEWEKISSYRLGQDIGGGRSK